MDAKYIKSLLNCFAEVIQENGEFLTEQDSIMGDRDLGLTMSDDFQTAAEAVRKSNEIDTGRLLYMAGGTMSVVIPSTMGTLTANELIQAGKALKGVCELGLNRIAQFFQAYEAGVVCRGKTNINEKMFLDGIDPAAQSMRSGLKNHGSLESLAQKTYEAVYAGYENTAAMLTVHGRTATRGEMNCSLKDPGVCVAMLTTKAFVKPIK